MWAKIVISNYPWESNSLFLWVISPIFGGLKTVSFHGFGVEAMKFSHLEGVPQPQLRDEN